jgi:hypothetical protein
MVSLGVGRAQALFGCEENAGILASFASDPPNVLGVSCTAGRACRSRSGAAVAAEELRSHDGELQPPRRRHARKEVGSLAAVPKPGRASFTPKLGRVTSIALERTRAMRATAFHRVFIAVAIVRFDRDSHPRRTPNTALRNLAASCDVEPHANTTTPMKDRHTFNRQDKLHSRG